jgi:hemoglobin-like flavoprotein
MIHWNLSVSYPIASAEYRPGNPNAQTIDTVEQLKRRCQMLEEKNKELNNAYQIIRNANIHLRTLIDMLHTVHYQHKDTHQTLLNNYKSETDRLKRDVEHLKDELTKKQEKITKLENLNNKTKQEAKSQKKELTHKIDTQSANHATLEQELNASVKIINDYAHRFIQILHYLNRHVNENNAHNEKTNDLKACILKKTINDSIIDLLNSIQASPIRSRIPIDWNTVLPTTYVSVYQLNPKQLTTERLIVLDHKHPVDQTDPEPIDSNPKPKLDTIDALATRISNGLELYSKAMDDAPTAERTTNMQQQLILEINKLHGYPDDARKDIEFKRRLISAAAMTDLTVFNTVIEALPQPHRSIFTKQSDYDIPNLPLFIAIRENRIDIIKKISELKTRKAFRDDGYDFLCFIFNLKHNNVPKIQHHCIDTIKDTIVTKIKEGHQSKILETIQKWERKYRVQ